MKETLLPLLGKGVLVTRPRHQAGELLRQLERLGARPFFLATLEVGDPPDWGPVDQALATLDRYHWLVFTSSNGVHALMGRLSQTGRDLRALGSVKLAVIGPATAEALCQYDLRPDLIPPHYNSEALAEALLPRVAGQRLLLARANRGRDLLRQVLSRVAKVDQVAVYSQIDCLEADPVVLEALHRGDIHFITVTSSNIARALARLMDPPIQEQIRQGAVRLVSISPVTSEDIRAAGWPVAVEAAEATLESVVWALVSLAAQG
jgi:uroporphyrinogen III methyltransferase/synthase